MTNNCEECEYKLITPNAQFMFSSVEKCKNCGDVRRPDESIGHRGIPRQVRELTED